MYDLVASSGEAADCNQLNTPALIPDMQGGSDMQGVRSMEKRQDMENRDISVFSICLLNKTVRCAP